MAVLKAKARNKLAADTFGLPATRQYPMPDRAHAANAEARATQQLAAGNLTPEQASKVKHKAHVVLGTYSSTYHR
jgi:hypothetical protein